ncbi:hypothetical protein [Bradyrhizobium murdochi]|uniref:hypothetical protein n=1 Tax=Bradyrhizobium murdochi TaxID=1038859 RepID=UPI0012EB4BB2|nr:hypothetical protein [Bradyrhizobium murdochi]
MRSNTTLTDGYRRILPARRPALRVSFKVEQAVTPHRCQIALEIITPGRHNAACSFINRKAPMYQRTLTGGMVRQE